MLYKLKTDYLVTFENTVVNFINDISWKVDFFHCYLMRNLVIQF